MRVLLLTRYDRLGASSRVRTFQYISYFESRGWQLDISPFFPDSYLENLYSGQSSWREAISSFLRRIGTVLKVRKYDFVWIEKELFPFIPALVESFFKQLKIPYVVDYDDALFHRYDQHRLRAVRSLLGRKIDAVMRNSSLVVAGNQYLALRARTAGAKRIAIVPTVVDLERYPSKYCKEGKKNSLVVGWIGTPKTAHYLHPLKNVFESTRKDFEVRFAAVGADKISLGDLPVESWPWSEDTEVDSIRRFDIGIMPLENSAWERGKCGYKLIQYMACGRPVVASPVGVNREIVDSGVNGFLADSTDDWRRSLAVLLTDSILRRKMGCNGRIDVERRYCLQAQAPRLESIMRLAMQR